MRNKFGSNSVFKVQPIATPAIYTANAHEILLDIETDFVGSTLNKNGKTV